MPHKVLLVGLDGATFDIVRPLAAQGRLPVINDMMNRGAAGVLRSTIPPVTPSAWTTIFTGKNAGKHGIYDFQELEPDTYTFRTVRTDEHREKTLWHLLDDVGKRSVIIDVPFTYPPKPLNGLMLTGYGTPRTDGTIFTFPEDFAGRLPPELRSEVRVALPTNRFDRSARFIQEWEEVMAGRQRLLQYLISAEPWDFFMVVFSITDNMAHVFWTYVDPAHPNYYRSEAEAYREAFFHGYQMCDRLLGELVERAGKDTTTLVISDHGFGSVRPRQYVYRRLLQGGYLRPKAAGGMPLGARLVRFAVDTYNRFPRLREWVKGLQPDNRTQLKQSLQRTGIMPSEQSIDFARSRVIPSNFGLRMWINDDERFPQGQVPAASRDALLAELRDYLAQDRDAVTGRPIIANTYLGSELYSGPHARNGPDLVIEYANLFDPEQHNPRRNPHVEGGHTLDGIFLAHGPAVAHNKPNATAKLTDIAPTVLHLLNLPVPPDMDGRVLQEIFDATYMRQNPAREGDKPARMAEKPASDIEKYSKSQEQELEEQFRQLGYID